MPRKETRKAGKSMEGKAILDARFSPVFEMLEAEVEEMVQ